MTVDEFARLHPELAFDFSRPIGEQPRLYEAGALAGLPEELLPSHAYRSGGRGRANLNQTKSHSQCALCKRVLRNDYFYAPPSLRARNVLYTHCLSCAQRSNRQRYTATSTSEREWRSATWRYLAPACTLCGFSAHPSALELHHARSEKEATITSLVDHYSARPTATNGERLLREAKEALPLCANCHRMVHAGALQLPAGEGTRPAYSLTELLSLLDDS